MTNGAKRKLADRPFANPVGLVGCRQHTYGANAGVAAMGERQQQELEIGHIAMRIAAYIRYITLHMKNLMTFMSLGFLLTLLAAVSYPFDKPQIIAWSATLILICLLFTVGTVLAQMGLEVIAVSNGIDTSVYTTDFAPRTGNRIVFVGRLDDEKHIDELVDATARLDAALDVQVDIVGAGEAREKLQAQARELGVADRIRFRGKLSDAELRATLTAATVFAMPSRAELQCIAAMEGMASALPVVAANAMALPHLVRDGVNGHLYEPGDVDGFAAGLTDVLTASPERLDAMKKASLAIVAEHSMAHTLDVFEAIYQDRPIPSAPAAAPTAERAAPDPDRTGR